MKNLKELIQNHTHRIVDKNENEWDVVEVSELQDVIQQDEEERQELLSALRSCVMSMQAHPDCEPNSEFETFVNKGWEAIKKATGE